MLSDGSKIPADLVVVGVGAKPNTDLFKGQLDFLEQKPGGIKVGGWLLFRWFSKSTLYQVFRCCSFGSACAVEVLVCGQLLGLRSRIVSLSSPS